MSLLLLTAIAITLFCVNRLNILPSKYYWVFTIALLLIFTVLTLLLVLPSKKGRKIRTLIACILSFIMILGCAGITNVGCRIYRTMQSVTNTTIITTEYAIYVKTENPAQKIVDIKDYTIGLSYIQGDQTLDKALSSLEEELGYTVNTVTYANVPELINALYLGEINAIILDSGYLSLFDEIEFYADFHTRTRVIHEFTVEEEVVIPTEPATEPTSGSNEDTNVEEEEYYVKPFILYISGSDTRKPTLARSRSDVNILAVVNPQTKQILLINTPRGFYVPNPAGNGALDKLTHCGIYGIDCSVKALADLYDISIDYFAQINFAGFKTMIDAIDGITVYSDLAFSGAYYSFQVGPNELDGDKALEFARTRYGLPGGDNTRGKHQMKVLSAVIEKMSSTSTLISNYSEILDSLQGMFQTSMTQELISDLIRMQLSDMASWNIQSYSVTGTGSSQITFSMPGHYLSVKIPNMETIEHATNLINRVLSGEILKPFDMVVPEY